MRGKVARLWREYTDAVGEWEMDPTPAKWFLKGAALVDATNAENELYRLENDLEREYLEKLSAAREWVETMDVERI
jgi:hypothetical protein